MGAEECGCVEVVVSLLWLTASAPHVGRVCSALGVVSVGGGVEERRCDDGGELVV